MISDLSHLSIFQQIKVKAGFIFKLFFFFKIFVGGNFFFYATLLSPVSSFEKVDLEWKNYTI